MQLKSLDSIEMPSNKVLIEYFNTNEELKLKGLNLKIIPKNYGSSDSLSTGKGRHLERTGKVIKTCNRLTNYVHTTYKGNLKRKYWNWNTDIEINEGDYVWFSSSNFDNAHKFTYDGRNFLVMDYHRLYMNENHLLNGYMLCEKVEQPQKSKLIHSPKKTYYDYIYKVYMRAHPIEYTKEHLEIPNSIGSGDYIMVRFDIYPKLEEAGHKYFSDKELFIFQTKEVIAQVIF